MVNTTAYLFTYRLTYFAFFLVFSDVVLGILIRLLDMSVGCSEFPLNVSHAVTHSSTAALLLLSVMSLLYALYAKPAI